MPGLNANNLLGRQLRAACNRLAVAAFISASGDARFVRAKNSVIRNASELDYALSGYDSALIESNRKAFTAALQLFDEIKEVSIDIRPAFEDRADLDALAQAITDYVMAHRVR